MTCYANLMAELPWWERLDVVLGNTHEDVGLIPWYEDCAEKHGAAMSREIRSKAAASLAGRVRQRPPRKTKTSDEKDEDVNVVHQARLF